MPPAVKRDESRHYLVPGYGHVYWQLDLKDIDESMRDAITQDEPNPLLEIDFNALIAAVDAMDETDPRLAELYEVCD